MIKKYKFFLLFFTLIVFFLLNIGYVSALEIKSYLPIPGYITPSASCTGNSCLSIYISYWFGFLVYIAGFLAVVSFAVGAVRLIMSVENPEAHGDAVDRIKGSVLGLILTLSAFIILRTINPFLINPTLTPLPGVAGVFYTNGSENKPVGLAVDNVASRGEDLIKGGFNRLIYKCSESGGGTGPVLLIWKFPKPNFQGNDDNYSGVVVVRKKCGEVENISNLGSFKMSFETPGVYYCLGGCSGNNMCSGYMSESNVASGQLSDPFKGKIKSIIIVNDIANDVRYGAILHKDNDPERGGTCLSPMIRPDGINEARSCFDIVSSISSASLFVWNAKTPESSGDGIEFYSEPFGWDSGAKAWKNFLDKAKIKNFWVSEAQKLTFDYTNVDRPQEYTKLYTDFQKHPGSIRVKGDYFVVIYSQNFYCQIFYKDVPNLNEMEFVAVKNKIDYVHVIPTK